MVPYVPPVVTREIPVIDLAPALGADIAMQRAVAWEIHKACRGTGFFLIANHGVDAGLVQAQFAASQRFFDLPLHERMALHMSVSPTHAGYEPIGGQTLDSDTPPDLKESFYVNQDLPDDHHYVKARLRAYGGNLWPALPGFRAQMLAYYAAMAALSRQLMRLFALSLDLDAAHFEPYFDCPSATLRLIKYPPHPAAARRNQLGAGAHTDWGAVTILAQDASGGLEVENAAGEWIDAPPVPGTFVINLGDMFNRWTNGLYRSNMHRVVNKATGRDRYSIPFFMSPDHQAMIECLPSCTDVAHPPRYTPCTAGEHLDEMFRRSYGDLRGGRPPNERALE
jgi:isopenicillin N synthase-like dioxygenase